MTQPATLAPSDPIAAQIALLPTSLVIPTLNDGTSDYTMRVRLDGSVYILRFLYNQRLDRWSLTITDDAEDLLAAGIPIVANWGLIRFYKYDPRLPPGEFMAIDLSGDGSPPGLLEMAPGARVRFVYFPAASVVAGA